VWKLRPRISIIEHKLQSKVQPREAYRDAKRSIQHFSAR